MMAFTCRAFAALAVLVTLTSSATLAAATSDEPAHTLGACGGEMTGYDRRQYTCDPDRKPACEAETGQRCRCLEQLDCGGQRDEPF